MSESWKQSCRTLLLALLTVMALFPAVGRAQQILPELAVYPDLIVHHGKIVTMNDYEINTNVGTIVEAMAVRGNRIWKLGKNDDILKYAGPNTVRIDAKGRTIIPGIVDAHTHTHDYALNDWLDANPDSMAVKIFNVQGNTVEEIKKNVEVLIRERMQNVPKEQWTFFRMPMPPHGTGGGPGFDLVRQGLMSTQDIDKLGVKSPLLLQAHPAYVINTPAKEALKAMYGGEPAPGPLESWDERGFSGLGTEYRREVVVDGYFNDKTDELAEIVLKGMQQNAAVGITTFSSHIMGIKNMDAYMRLSRQNRFPIRFGFTHYTGFNFNSDAEGFYRRLGDMAGLGNDYFWFSGIGLGYIDIGPPLFCSSIVPEAERDIYSWCRYSPKAPNYKTVVTALSHGYRVLAGHNYGDLSADYFMDSIEEAMKLNPEITLDYIRSMRLSMDHMGLYPRPDQLPRIKRLGMRLSASASGMSRNLPWIQKYGFEKYQGWIMPVKSALDAGIRVAFEAEGDMSGGLFSYMLPLITRKNKQGVIVARNEAVERNTTMKMATNWSSEFMLKEKDLGSLEPGKMADFLILNQDYFTVPIEQLGRTIPLMTVVGGKISFLREEFAKELGMAPAGLQFKFAWERDAAGGTRRGEGE